MKNEDNLNKKWRQPQQQKMKTISKKNEDELKKINEDDLKKINEDNLKKKWGKKDDLNLQKNQINLNWLWHNSKLT